ncbi:MAG: polysaccharide biosynthesis/export family protein [Pyrinomonadaceae bacterium]|nr:polysaccharide biosynthesis/export family protein [Pyrinomonadaceae bacterium]
MKTPLLGKFTLPVIAMTLAISSSVSAQTEEQPIKKVNFRYSQNPKTRSNNNETASKNTEKASVTPALPEIEKIENTEPKPSIARKTFEIAKKSAAIAPTEIYKVGIGDVLFINLQNAPKSSTYYTVLNDGTIDYPLAGEMLSVSGLTTEEIEDLLKEKIKLFENPQISVKVRDYSSHTISVIGLVERAGEKKLQREAIPLYVVRAESLVKPEAVNAVIRRSDSKVETVNLTDQNADNILIFAGDIVEFTGEKMPSNSSSNAFYFIGGEIINGGQKEFHEGLTLTQAVLASGGLKKNVKKVIVRRKNNEGLLIAYEYNLKAIKEGKSPDPVLLAGDTIEIGM